ncbi:hypothetical protein MW871_16175 [Flavobacterium sp. I-SCBP12n]|uniref:DUF2971 domain-containing protein n=1 Tax=Flavobacterium pygoscelis TaxID=2893176 RepID=A0A9X1XUG2_9FLAO|nr:hypothetical protein [Flavobacterium pygoscelis]MCK8143429.1 hypothetical protein [Flavobacterium pygoscelis]
MEIFYKNSKDFNFEEIVPKIVYKYRDFNDVNHKKIIQNQEIYLSKSSKFNCPYEMDVKIDREYVKDELNRRKYYQNFLKLSSLYDPEIERLLKEVIITDEKLTNHENLLKEEYDKMFGVFSMSETYRNKRLWKDFGANKKGFCVGIDFLKAIPINEGFRGRINYVKREELPKKKILDIEGIDKYIMSFLDWIFTLPEQYYEEQEYRFTKTINSDLERFKKISKESIYEIIIGEKMSKTNQKEIIEMINIYLPNTKIKKLIYSKIGFKEIVIK